METALLRQRGLAYAAVVLGVLAVAAGGSYFTELGLPWYYALRLPAIAPPGGVIGVAWTLIYLLCIASLILWISQAERSPRFYLVIWLAVLNGVLNALWCFMFFTMHWIGAAIVEMLLLEATVVALIVLMWRKRILAAVLFIPYALWLLFATWLAWSFWQLNR
jgi:tryptophan-rich sensory protein